jgi:hypothetical protein
MKTFWLNFIVMVMTVASFQFLDHRNSSDFSSDKIETLSAIDDWNLNTLKEADSKSGLKHSYIAQEFISIVALTQSQSTSIHFGHYLPIHNLIREKDYFLLI